MRNTGGNVAVAELFREQRLPLRQFLLGLLSNRAEADDALQEVFLKLVENGPSIRLDTAKSWLFTVAYREAMAYRCRRIRQNAVLAELWGSPVWQDDRVPPTPDAEAMRCEAIEAVRGTLAALPAARRDVVERPVYRNQTFQTIANELGCPLGTVLTRMRRALQALAHLLEE